MSLSHQASGVTRLGILSRGPASPHIVPVDARAAACRAYRRDPGNLETTLQSSSPHSRQAGVTRRQFNSGRFGSLYSIQ